MNGRDVGDTYPNGADDVMEYRRPEVLPPPPCSASTKCVSTAAENGSGMKQDISMNFTNLIKNTREEGFLENSKFKVLVHGLCRGSP